MKKNKPISLAMAIAVISSCLFISSCKKTEFTGQVTDTNGNVVKAGTATIYAWKENSKEPKEIVIDFNDGRLNGKLPMAQKYVVNIHAKGFGLVSKVFYSVPPERTYELKKATEIPVNPATGASVQDTQNNCPGSISFRANWTVNPLAGVPIQLNADGMVSGFGMPPELSDAYYYHAKTGNCNNGINVNIPANSIAAPGTVTVSMSVIDLFSPDGMPGDNLAEFGNGSAFMESYGAFSLQIYDGEKTYNLNKEKGAAATISFPADVFPKGKELPKRIPLLSYNEKSGIWESETFADLDATNKFYIAQVTHFSAINLDIEKTNPACVRFQDNAADGFDPPYQVEVTQPASGGGAPFVRSRPVNAADLCPAPNDRQFALTRLLPDTYTSVAFFTGTIPKAFYVVKSSPASPILIGGAQPDCTNLVLCGNFKPFDKTIFDNVATMTTHDTLISACRTGADIFVSMASKDAFATAGFKINIENAGSAVCNGDHLLSSLTLISDSGTPSPPSINFRTALYQLNCGAVGLDEAIVLLNPVGDKSSNKILIAPSCTP